MSRGRPRRFPVGHGRALALIAAALAAGCGHKAPPLPPLVRVPAAPELKAERKGSTVDLQLTIPSANTDGTRPANIERVDVYGFTGPVSVSDEELLKRAAKVASVAVKAPRDPDQTIEPGEPLSDLEPLTGEGLDQGSHAHLDEQLTASTFAPTELPKPAARRSGDSEPEGPLLGPLAASSSRTYIGVGVNKRGRKGPLSRRVAVPLIPAPSPPSSPTVSYTETTITVAWTPPTEAAETASGGVLPSRPIGTALPTLAYNVYDIPPASDAASDSSRTAQTAQPRLLTETPVAEPHYADTRIEWGAERCYVVRTVETVGNLTVESDAREPACTKLVDTFPPAAPKGLKAISTAGTIHLIWEPNSEKDLAGYILLRAPAPAERLDPIVSTPIQETTFDDGVRPGVRYVYAVKAVDKAGNESQPSERAEETAR